MDRAGPAEDLARRLAERQHRHVATSLAVFVLLYLALGVVDFVLMRRYARRRSAQTPEAGRAPPDAARGRGRRALMDARDRLVLPDRRPLGRLLPARGVRLRRRHAAAVPARATSASAACMFESIGPVWDGNEVWLVVAGGRDVRRVPGLVRDDVLGLLHRAAADPRAADRPRRLVRVARARATSPRWRAIVAVGEHVGELRRAVHLGRRAGQPRCTACRSTPRTSSPATSSTCSAPTPCSPALAVVLLFALHGATYLTLRTAGDCASGPRRPRGGSPSRRGRSASRSWPGRSSSRTTATSKGVVPAGAPGRARRHRRACCWRRWFVVRAPRAAGRLR